jgi:hypothetical protein
MNGRDFLSQLMIRGRRITDIFNFTRSKAIKWQETTLKKMLYTARNTEYGQKYGFDDILISKNPVEEYRKRVPLVTYSQMHEFWLRQYNGEADITWPGRCTHFALSSGTTEGASKYIPVNHDQLKAMIRASRRQLLAMALTDIPKDFLTKDYLMLGGCTDLNYNGISYSGDLSGITTANIPNWFERFSRPGPEITAIKDWEEKVNRIVEEAPQWDIVMLAGAPSWMRLLIERIIKRYQVNNIHEIWPNLSIYCWGAVALAPYRQSLDSMMGRPIIYMESYLASEAYVANQTKPDAGGMRLVFRNNTYFEFVAFNEENFDADSNLKPTATAIGLEDVVADTDYAIILTTPAGAWRYMIGDTIRFTNPDICEIKITGRTKQFLSITGEHLSVDNMMDGLRRTADDFQTDFTEFTVKGVKEGSNFVHHWYISNQNTTLDTEAIKGKLDQHLRELNDDYHTERNHVLTGMYLHLLPEEVFLTFLEKHLKLGGQSKFPRVLSDNLYPLWVEHVKSYVNQPST